MAEEELPVFVQVPLPAGGVDRVRVGTAVRTAEGFLLRLGDLTIGSTPVARAASASTFAPPPDAAGGPVFPNYGRSKGMPIAGASQQDLEFYANGCRRTLSDPAKARWHDKERSLLAAIEAEEARQRGDESRPPPPGDDDIPF